MAWNPLKWYEKYTRRRLRKSDSEAACLYSTLAFARSQIALSRCLTTRQKAEIFRTECKAQVIRGNTDDIAVAKYGYALMSLGELPTEADTFRRILQTKPDSLVTQYFFDLISKYRRSSQPRNQAEGVLRTENSEQAQIAALDLLSVVLRRLAFKGYEDGKELIHIVTFDNERLEDLRR